MRHIYATSMPYLCYIYAISTLYLPTGAGDGDSVFCIYNDGEIDTAPLNYFTLISGKFNIYDYDCGSTVAETVEGSFQVYYSSGIVLFYKSRIKITAVAPGKRPARPLFYIFLILSTTARTNRLTVRSLQFISAAISALPRPRRL